MSAQFTYDSSGNPVGVFLPIEEWNKLLQIPEVNELQQHFEVPEWQMELGRKELENIANGTAGLMDWETAKTQFRL